MNMQQMMIQAQKMKRELDKAMKEFEAKEFSVSKGGAVTVTMYGSLELKAIEINEDAFEKDNKEMVEEMIVLAYNELLEQIQDARDEINERITGSKGGLGF